MNIGDFIKINRVNRGLSQKQLADRAGVTQASVAYWENGLRMPSAENFLSIAKVLDISSEELSSFSISLAKTAKSEEELKPSEIILDALLADYKNKYSPSVRLLSAFSELNDIGQQEAVKRVEELTEIPRYTKELLDNEDECEN